MGVGPMTPEAGLQVLRDQMVAAILAPAAGHDPQADGRGVVLGMEVPRPLRRPSLWKLHR